MRTLPSIFNLSCELLSRLETKQLEVFSYAYFLELQRSRADHPLGGRKTFNNLPQLQLLFQDKAKTTEINK